MLQGFPGHVWLCPYIFSLMIDLLTACSVDLMFPRDAFYVYLCTTDQGSNESWARKSNVVETSDMQRVLYLDSDCLEHSPHLIVLSSLHLVDDMLAFHQRPWKYFSTLAMFSHAARDCHKQLYDSWYNHFGAAAASAHAKKIFPRAVAQRWGRVHELESRMLSAGFLPLAICLSDVLARKYIDVKDSLNFYVLSTNERNS